MGSTQGSARSTPTATVTCPACGKKNRVPAAATGVARCGACHEHLPWIADADDRSYTDVVEQSVLPVLVDMWAPWCGPCKLVAPALDRLAVELRGRLKVARVNVDECPETARRFAVQGIPTLLVVKGTDVLARTTGALPFDQLRTWAEEAIAAQR